MATLFRYRAGWSGFTGGPGVSTFYSSEGGSMVASLHTFFAALVSFLPSDVSIQVENTGDEIDAATGDLVGSWVEASVLPVVGTSGVGYAAPAGGVVSWHTSTVADSHRLRGRTFIVPMESSVFESDGDIGLAITVPMQAAGAALISAEATGFSIWHRPREARAADGSHPAVTARAGSSGLVTACSVSQKAAVLRSRRD